MNRKNKAPRKRMTHRELNERSVKKHGCSYRVWANAKKRHGKYFGKNLWLVTGGENPHRVYFSLARVICDCGNQEYATNNVCSHIQVVKNELIKIAERHKKGTDR